MILLTRFENGYRVYKDLGEEWHLIDKEACADEFKRCCEQEFKGDKKFEEETHAFIFIQNGSHSIPLFKGQDNIILSETGQEFKNLTFR